MKGIKFFCKAVNAKEDCEKLVTPAIVYIYKKDGDVEIFWIGIGWWHYAITFAIGIKR